MQNQTLTKSEMTVMNILWEMPDGGTVYDVLAKYEEPKPAYTTTATFMKILEKKGYLEAKKLSGRTYTYSPLVSKEDYCRRAMQDEGLATENIQKLF